MMNNLSILSLKHFNAFNQVVEDYKSLLHYEQELLSYKNGKGKTSSERVKKEIVFLLERVIVNKDILKENTSADHEYLNSLLNDTK